MGLQFGGALADKMIGIKSSSSRRTIVGRPLFQLGAFAFLGLLSLSCATPLQPSKMPLRPLAVFCGCSACADAVKRIGVTGLSGYSVMFLGSPAEASEFRKTHGLNQSVTSDIDGSASKAFGITECPAFLLTTGNFRRVIGNGIAITKSEWLQILRASK